MGFYTDKKVVVTGGAGFLGSHLVELLLAQGAEVVAVDTLVRGTTHVPGTEIHQVDAGDPRQLYTSFKGAFAVFNLAAHVAGVVYNQHNHAEMFAENLRLQTVPLQVAERAEVPHVLQVSSACVYAPEHNSPAYERYGHAGEPVAANSGYSWAKRMGERAALWSSIPHVVIVRPSNLYGPRDYFDERAHVIPKMIRMCTEGAGPIITRGSGTVEREFLYVEDAARGLLAALEHGAHGRAYNLGTNGQTRISMEMLLELVRVATGMLHRPIERQSAAHDEGDPRRWSDASALNALGWRHTLHLLEGLKRTAEWYATRR